MRTKEKAMSTIYKLPLVLEPQPEGGFTVTCPFLPELITEGDSIKEALDNAEDALLAVIEAYEDLGRPLPTALQPMAPVAPMWLETAVAVS
jgi:antitoxin HicB